MISCGAAYIYFSACYNYCSAGPFTLGQQTIQSCTYNDITEINTNEKFCLICIMCLQLVKKSNNWLGRGAPIGLNSVVFVASSVPTFVKVSRRTVRGAFRL